jgi:hypothetical protein
VRDHRVEEDRVAGLDGLFACTDGHQEEAFEHRQYLDRAGRVGFSVERVAAREAPVPEFDDVGRVGAHEEQCLAARLIGPQGRGVGTSLDPDLRDVVGFNERGHANAESVRQTAQRGDAGIGADLFDADDGALADTRALR